MLTAACFVGPWGRRCVCSGATPAAGGARSNRHLCHRHHGCCHWHCLHAATRLWLERHAVWIPGSTYLPAFDGGRVLGSGRGVKEEGITKLTTGWCTPGPTFVHNMGLVAVALQAPAAQPGNSATRPQAGIRELFTGGMCWCPSVHAAVCGCSWRSCTWGRPEMTYMGPYASNAALGMWEHTSLAALPHVCWASTPWCGVFFGCCESVSYVWPIGAKGRP